MFLFVLAPGTQEAIDSGCTCVIHSYRTWQDVLTGDVTNWVQVMADCPLHGKDAPKDEQYANLDDWDCQP